MSEGCLALEESQDFLDKTSTTAMLIMLCHNQADKAEDEKWLVSEWRARKRHRQGTLYPTCPSSLPSRHIYDITCDAVI